MPAVVDGRRWRRSSRSSAPLRRRTARPRTRSADGRRRLRLRRGRRGAEPVRPQGLTARRRAWPGRRDVGDVAGGGHDQPELRPPSPRCAARPRREFSARSSPFARSSAARRSTARPMPRVQLEQRQLQRDDPDRARTRPAPIHGRPADQAVDQAVLGQRRASARGAARSAERGAAAAQPAPARRAGRAARGARGDRRCAGARRVARRAAPRGPAGGAARRAAAAAPAAVIACRPRSSSFRAARRRADEARGLRRPRRRRHDRAAREQLGLGLAPARADGQVGRADAARARGRRGSA